MWENWNRWKYRIWKEHHDLWTTAYPWNDEKNSKGSIELDDQNIEDIGLHLLRQNITIIPQDPVLFSGTLRYNIDPFNTYDDEKIIDALKKVHIWNKLLGDEDVLKKTSDERKVTTNNFYEFWCPEISLKFFKA